MTRYVVQGILGSVVARVDSTDEVLQVVRGQMTMSEQAEAKLVRKLAATVAGQVSVDWGGVGCTIHVIDE